MHVEESSPNVINIGIDGCKSGWMAVSITDKGFGAGVYKSIEEICFEFRNSGSLLIDMPIGLPEGLCREVEYVEFNRYIFNKLAEEDIKWILSHCDRKLDEYYARINHLFMICIL